MTDQNSKQNSGLVEFLTSLMRGKDVTSRDVADLAAAVKTLATEFTVLAKSIATLAKIVHEHSLTINDLFTIQTYILQKMKDQGDESVTSVLQEATKNKPNKPN